MRQTTSLGGERSESRQHRLRAGKVLLPVLVAATMLLGGAAHQAGRAHSATGVRRTRIRRSSRIAGRCTIRGTNANDVLIGTPGPDVICGLAGNDVLKGMGGNDRLVGGPGDDLLVGGPGDDLLDGGAGNDIVSAVDGRPGDRLNGGPGRNLCTSDAEDLRALCAHPRVASRAVSVPILTYHVIGTPPAGTPNAGLWVPPRVFAAQMKRLAAEGYHAVSLWRVWNAWHGGTLPPKPIVISFDDGFADQFTHAMPILASHHWTGVLNLALSHLNQRGWGLTTRMVAAMIDAGWELDSHTLTHADLPSVGAAQQWQEIDRSRAILHRTFGVPIRFFCYPYGAYDAAVIGDVRRAGYAGATTTQPGNASPAMSPYTLPRYSVSATNFPF